MEPLLLQHLSAAKPNLHPAFSACSDQGCVGDTLSWIPRSRMTTGSCKDNLPSSLSACNDDCSAGDPSGWSTCSRSSACSCMAKYAVQLFLHALITAVYVIHRAGVLAVASPPSHGLSACTNHCSGGDTSGWSPCSRMTSRTARPNRPSIPFCMHRSLWCR